MPNQKILILTPVKDAEAHFESYFSMLDALSYPADLISLGLLEGDSNDKTYDVLASKMPGLDNKYRRARLWKKDFGFQLPPGVHRWAEPMQIPRRIVLAKARNHLLLHALDDEDWVLWLDIDVIEYPRDIIETLLNYELDILHPHCVLEYGGGTYDCNAWRAKGDVHMDELRGGEELVRLDAVGGTMLLIRADIHRDGLVFPPFPYGQKNRFIRDGVGEIETEGLGMLARDMGHQSWGLPNLEILHSKGSDKK